MNVRDGSPISPQLLVLRAELAAMGVTADSPGTLDPEGERLAREERLTERS